ncbi:hypothetical protein KFK09_027963 [Dendrobium nobile]|uniref:Uncharacterized protein n=1 Tax=Dendrobium nobile TaxID=94219 RepID=A0A8T3A1F2_DENNO|nr:hypothetical protein KFK09_027963 [Dendrobium nobile]
MWSTWSRTGLDSGPNRSSGLASGRCCDVELRQDEVNKHGFHSRTPLISLVNRIKRDCTVLGDHSEESALPTLREPLLSIAVVGVQAKELSNLLNAQEEIDTVACSKRAGRRECGARFDGDWRGQYGTVGLEPTAAGGARVVKQGSHRVWQVRPMRTGALWSTGRGQDLIVEPNRSSGLASGAMIVTVELRQDEVTNMGLA